MILFFIYDDMADFEFILTSHLIGHFLGKEVRTIAYENKIVKSKAGIKFLPDATVIEALSYNMEEIEGIIITGGWNDETRPELLDLINKLNNSGKLLGAICAGPKFLARAGVLTGRKYTTTWTEERVTQMKIPDPFPRETFQKGASLVRDGNIITALGVKFTDFAVEIADYLGLFKSEQEKAELLRSYK